MSAYVFLGPSLSRDDAQRIAPRTTLLPPAKAGDLYLSVRAGARVIGVVDGYFEQVPSVWHKEVLFALSRGVHVFGASSMGALRATELAPFGMVGIGRVFEAYRDGILDDDDEVAVVHASEEYGFIPLSEAMVNVRDGLARALERQVISAPAHNVLVEEIKRLDYPQRNWHVVLSIGERHGLPPGEIEALLRFVRTERPNVKRDDAIELLTVLAALDTDTLAPFEPAFEFESTVFWDQLVAGVRTAPASSAHVPIEAVRSHVGVVEDDAEEIFAGALLLYLVVKEAHRSGIEVEPDRVARVGVRFRRSHNLTSPEAATEWAGRNGLGDAELAALMEVLALVEQVGKHHSVALDAFLPAELQRRGRFEDVRSAITAKRAALDEFGLTFPSAEDLGTTTDDLLTWYERSFRPFDDLEDHIDARRLTESARFVRELVAEYLVDSRRGTTVADQRA